MKDEDLRLTDDDNISNNMNGIKSEKLYDFLQTLSTCKTDAVKNFCDITPHELLPLLLEHLLITIPNELFLKNSANDQQRLETINQWMTENFVKMNLFPFTILRICQLCYDPFKYFKINELTKFVNALEKCCVVTSPLDTKDDTDPEVKNIEKNQKTCLGPTDVDENVEGNDDDVSLVKIPWLDEVKPDPDFPQFLKDIDNIMSVNFGYDEGEDDEDEDDEDIEQQGSLDDNDILMGDHPGSNVIVEEYYEDDGDIESGNENIENVNITDQEVDSDDVDDEDYNENASESPSDEEEEEDEDLEEKGVPQGEISVQNSKTPRKRKPMELDIFDYSDNSQINNNELTTPKKYKQDDGTLVIESPVVTNTLENKPVNIMDPSTTRSTNIPGDSKLKGVVDSTLDKKTVVTTNVASTMMMGNSVLYSPCDEAIVAVNNKEKMRAITDINETSPLGNKTR